MEDYEYSILVEFEIQSSIINTLIYNQQTGRLSEKIYEYHKILNKESTLKKMTPEETNILCVLDVYESEETVDKISQLWMLKSESVNNPLWKNFSNNITKIRAIGGIPGAAELAKRKALS